MNKYVVLQDVNENTHLLLSTVRKRKMKTCIMKHVERGNEAFNSYEKRL